MQRGPIRFGLMWVYPLIVMVYLWTFNGAAQGNIKDIWWPQLSRLNRPENTVVLGIVDDLQPFHYRRSNGRLAYDTFACITVIDCIVGEAEGEIKVVVPFGFYSVPKLGWIMVAQAGRNELCYGDPVLLAYHMIEVLDIETHEPIKVELSTLIGVVNSIDFAPDDTLYSNRPVELDKSIRWIKPDSLLSVEDFYNALVPQRPTGMRYRLGDVIDEILGD